MFQVGNESSSLNAYSSQTPPILDIQPRLLYVSFPLVYVAILHSGLLDGLSDVEQPVTVKFITVSSFPKDAGPAYRVASSCLQNDSGFRPATTCGARHARCLKRPPCTTNAPPASAADAWFGS